MEGNLAEESLIPLLKGSLPFLFIYLFLMQASFPLPAVRVVTISQAGSVMHSNAAPAQR